MDISALLFKFLIAVSLGALMGLERDGVWKSKKQRQQLKRKASEASRKFTFIHLGIPADSIGGIRTYALISVLGALCGLAYSMGVKELTWVVSAGLIFFIHLSFVLNYFDKNSFGLTTEISIILNYILSFLLFATDIPIKIVVGITVINTILLSMKDQFKSIADYFTQREIVEMIKFVLFTIVVLPFLPNHNFGLGSIPQVGEYSINLFGESFVEQTSVFNPYKIWLVVVFILTLNFAAYFANKTLGRGKGIKVLGLLGGLISSTAVTQSLAVQSRKIKSIRIKSQFVQATALANMTSFFRILLIAFAIAPTFGVMLILPMLAMGGVLLVAVFLDVRRSSKSPADSQIGERVGLQFSSPFALKPALLFAGIYFGVTLFTSLALYYLGDSGYLVSSMISAASGLDAITISTSMIAGGEISFQLATVTLVIAACVNLLVKVFLVFVSGDDYFRKRITKLFLFDMAAGIIAMMFMIFR